MGTSPIQLPQPFTPAVQPRAVRQKSPDKWRTDRLLTWSSEEGPAIFCRKQRRETARTGAIFSWRFGAKGLIWCARKRNSKQSRVGGVQNFLAPSVGPNLPTQIKLKPVASNRVLQIWFAVPSSCSSTIAR